MQKFILFTFLGFCCLPFVEAQTGPLNIPPPQVLSDHNADHFEYTIMRQFALNPNSRDPGKSALAEEQAYRNWVFHKKVKRFIDLWRNFLLQSDDMQAFDPKLARKVAKAFHDMEKTEGWPAREGIDR